MMLNCTTAHRQRWLPAVNSHGQPLNVFIWPVDRDDPDLRRVWPFHDIRGAVVAFDHSGEIALGFMTTGRSIFPLNDLARRLVGTVMVARDHLVGSPEMDCVWSDDIALLDAESDENDVVAFCAGFQRILNRQPSLH